MNPKTSPTGDPVGEKQQEEYSKWPIFICYRRADGTAAARRIYDLIQGVRFKDKEGNTVEVDAYLDTETPGVSDWKAHHEPYLMRARSMIVICTPGACVDHGEDDWVSFELDWWLENQKEAPILIDPLGLATAYIPSQISKKWDSIQRVFLVEQELQQLSDEELRERLEAVKRQVIGSISKIGELVYQREVQKERARSKRLKRALVGMVALSSVALVSIVIGAMLFVTLQRSSIETATNLARNLAENGHHVRALKEIDQAYSRSPLFGFLTPERMRFSLDYILSISPILEIGSKITGNSANYVPHRPRNIKLKRFAPDGQSILLTTVGNEALVWDLRQEKQVGKTVKFNSEILDIAQDTNRFIVATLRDRRTVEIWNARDRTPLGPTLRLPWNVKKLAFGKGGKLVATFLEGNIAQVWDVDTGRQIGVDMVHDRAIKSIEFSSDGSRLLTQSSERSASLWETQAGTLIRKPLKNVGKIVFSKDGKRLASASRGSEKPEIQVWNSQDLSAVSKPYEFDGDLDSISFGPKGKKLLLVDRWDNRLEYRDIGDINVGSNRHLKIQKRVTSTSVSPDGRYIVTSSPEGLIEVLNARTGVVVGSARQQSNFASELKFSPNSSFFYSFSLSHILRIWRFDTRYQHTHLVVRKPTKARLRNILRADFSSDGKRLVTASSDHTARVWDSETGEEFGSPLRQEAPLSAVVFSPRGTMIATGANDGRVRLWKTSSRKQIGDDIVHDRGISSIEFHHTGKKLLTASSDGTARIWSAENGKPLIPPIKHRYPISLARFSPDGSQVATASRDGTARIWDAETGIPIGEPIQHESVVFSVDFSPDGSRVITASGDNSARFSDTSTGHLIGSPISHDRRLGFARFSPDGSKVLLRSLHQTVALHDAKTGAQIGSNMNQSIDRIHVYSATFSSDGALIATSGDDNSARIWDGKTTDLIGVTFHHRGPVRHAVFAPDSYRLATVSEDNTAIIWDLDVDLWKSVSDIRARLQQYRAFQ